MILTEREQRIFLLRKANHTLDAIAKAEGVSKERIRQIEATAHRKLRVAQREKEARSW